MAENLIPKVCEMLGVEVGEEFKIKNDNYDDIYKIGEAGNIYYIDKITGCWCVTFAYKIKDLINGKRTIVKLPWKPKLGEEYWTFSSILFNNSVETTVTWEVDSYEWLNAPTDFALFEKGWVYRTREEAEAALPAVAKELGVEYEL